MDLKVYTHQEYKRYCLAEGSQHIVSEFALFQILKLIQKYNIKKILEVGVGIGTISGSILMYSRLEDLSLKVSGTEANSFCLNQIPQNLNGDYNQMNLYRDVRDLPNEEEYELVIIDGGENNLLEIKRKLVRCGIVVIEGDRADQVELVRKIFPRSRYVQLISLERNGEYSVKNTDDYQGGLKVIFTDPTIRHHFHWLKLKIITKLDFYNRKISK
ncbi:hypothetical protein FK178_08460 [Antarcticibacterium arcticum]|uniref:Methyltransferase n=1 Tax=Antarcticibacterium arcticum TaxID=2585771 RepID=A0A5B8YIJ2_9FLAO|nr:hypothetical protein [Antarcticibacterium arcticum]QED37752.1 hypothetical protein FK178_08460 [Antarcticibacterium arcticum]